MTRRKVALIAVLCMAAGLVSAQTADTRVFSASCAGTTTNTASGIIRGVLDSVTVVVPSAMTSSVALVTSGGETIFSVSGLTGTSHYNLVYPGHNSAGTAVSDPVYVRKAVGSTVTATFIKTDSGTGTVSATVTYLK